MSFLYRPHRGGLDESMSEVETLDMESLTGKLVALFGPGDVEIKPYHYDARTDWNTHIVLWDGKAVGFTDGDHK
jgi:hypothetical protein